MPMTVEMVPGPATRGMPKGMMAKASGSLRLASAFWLSVLRSRGSSP